MKQTPILSTHTKFHENMTRLLQEKRRPFHLGSESADVVLESRIQSRLYQKESFDPTLVERSLSDLNAVLSIAYDLCYLMKDETFLQRVERQIDALKGRFSHASVRFVSGSGNLYRFEQDALFQLDELVHLLFRHHQESQELIM